MRLLLDVEPSGAPPYPVYLGHDLRVGLDAVWQAGWRRVALVGDTTTMRLFGDATEEFLAAVRSDIEVHRVAFEPGEKQKTRATKAAIEDALLEAGFDRHSVIVGVGGGLVLDVAGFVAATYYRGIAHINIATTLLAQVDAAIGGKTAVNVPHGKNLIGAMHHPRAVLLDTGALVHLPSHERRQGLAEAVKHAVLADENLFEALERWAAQDASETGLPPDDVLGRCVAIKAEVVAADTDDHGRRQSLNFGHTVAHAIEAASAHGVSHGDAVAVGMVIEARVAAMAHRFPHDDVTRIVALLTKLGFSTHPPVSFRAASPFFRHDKKSVDGACHCALPTRLGAYEAVDGQFTQVVELSTMARAWGS